VQEIKAVSYDSNRRVSYLPTLVVDANITAAKELADGLTHSGFSADIAISFSAARAASRRRYYGTIVFFGDLSRPAVLECVAELRKRSSRTWIIAISSTAPTDAQELALRPTVDALLTAPFPMRDLITRLFAFSLRSRPP
jgi:DNA-binding response OmpR family regulator